MAKPKKDAGGKADGFKIPIEDAAEEAAKEVTDDKGAAEAKAEAAPGTADAAQAQAETVEAEVLEEGDIVAEAEAVVEQAAAEAEAEAADAAPSAEALEAARKESQEWQDRYMRLHAEWDTYRRRTTEQRAEEKLRATEKLVENLLPVLDDFERSIAYATENGESGLLDGVKAVYAKLVDALVKDGVVVIDPAGEPFDALEAQAVGTVPDEEAFDETVRDVYQKGYKMGKKVLRPAMVTITTGGPTRPKEDEAEAAEGAE